MKRRPGSEFCGEYWQNRWRQYLKFVGDLADKQAAASVLEIGANGLGIYTDSDTMEVRERVAATYHHDATVTPWPIPDKAYDLGIATQVWEHLKGGQAQAFAELRRTCRRAILSYPLGWKTQDPGNCHNGITKATIDAWAGHHPFAAEYEVGSPGRRRLVRVYDLGEEQ